ncbi:hypothetical protein LTR56_027465 [Elasticomyces elasticus]|nr:hypothetical protein LTR56_027465 [Elasticomyces elasticus]KAK3615296.1 hypothetical protein LTR22_027491 [Elasticomyces elasticus]KAK4896688.1 hypothetical protein LTR49_028098 [Elasticomyces elasticus]KAK5733142.1 hypothetical protein LTS12_026990 [Elasticomyces elasticus]
MSSAHWQETPTPAPIPTPANGLRASSKRYRKSTAKAAEPDSAASARASKRPKTNGYGHADVTSEPDDPSTTPKPLDTTLMELSRSAGVHFLTGVENKTGEVAWLTDEDIIEHLVKERGQPEYYKFFKNLTEGEVRGILRGVFDSEEERPASDRKLYRGAPQVEGIPLDKNATYWSVSSKAQLSQDAMTSGEAANSPLQRNEGPVSDRRLDQHHGAEETELSPQGLVPTDHGTMQPTLLDKLHLDVTHSSFECTV